MSDQDKTFIWKIVRWTLGVFSTLMAAAILSIVATAKNVVFDVHDLKNSREVIQRQVEDNHSQMTDRVYKMEQNMETMRREWREDQRMILEKLDKMNDKWTQGR